jgi:osmotically-inducible protein OsmY
VQVTVKDGVATLAGRVARWSAGDIADRLIRQIPGVVGVVNELTWEYDDRDMLGPGMAFGIA